MKTRIINYFHFSHRERLGVFTLFILCVATFSTPKILQMLRPKTETDFSDFEAVIRAYKQSSAAATVDTGRCFDFDPNLATLEEFKQLGLSEKVASNICHYREKGGVFRKPDDFKKIWSLNPEDYERLLPYIRISQKSNGFSKAAQYDEAERPAYLAKYASYQPQKHLPKKPVDLNTADVETLMTLPLVGEKRASQIVNFREKLGGFLTVEQLSEMYNLPDSVFQVIQPLLSVGDGPAHKLNLNTVSLETLDAHPYISRKQATLITEYRAQHGNFAAVEDVLKIKAFTDKTWWDKISPYLTTE